MATRKRVSAGKSISDIMKMPISELQNYTASQQREIVSRLASAANKRINSLVKRGIDTPALININMSGGKLSVKGKSGDELISEFYKARSFLRSPTSTVRGWNKVLKGVEKAFNEMSDIYLPGTDIKYNNAMMGNAFALYDILSRTDPLLMQGREKYKIASKIAEFMYSGNAIRNYEEVMDMTLSYLQNQYEQEQERYNATQRPLGRKIDRDIPERFKR